MAFLGLHLIELGSAGCWVIWGCRLQKGEGGPESARGVQIRESEFGHKGHWPQSDLGLLSALLQAVQSIGNLGQQLGQGKELWLAPLHPFLLQSISRVRDFLDQLVDVDGAEGEPCDPAAPDL